MASPLRRRSLFKRRAWESNPQPVSRHHISSVTASHSLTLRKLVAKLFYAIARTIAKVATMPSLLPGRLDRQRLLLHLFPQIGELRGWHPRFVPLVLRHESLLSGSVSSHRRTWRRSNLIRSPTHFLRNPAQRESRRGRWPQAVFQYSRPVPHAVIAVDGQSVLVENRCENSAKLERHAMSVQDYSSQRATFSAQ